MSLELISELDNSEIEPPEPAARERISALCVDCDPYDAEIVGRVAARSRQLEIDVSVCHTLAEAYALLNARQFDVIYIEYWLGDQTSVPFICASAANHGAPCIVLTGLNEPDIRRVAFRAGAQGFLSKKELSAHALESVTLSVLLPTWNASPVA